MKHSKKIYAWALPLIVVAFIVDRISKWWAVEHLAPDTIPLIPGVLQLEYVPNPNIVFFLTWPVWIMLVIVAAVLLLMLWLAVSEFQRGHHAAVALLALVLSGAVSNAIDRIRLGAVVDFFRVPFWSIFNLSDIYIVLGVLGVVWLTSRRVDENQHD